MPTENRFCSTEMVSVPRQQLQAWQERFSKAQMFQQSTEIKAALAQQSPQPQAEPVAHARICGVGFDSKGNTVSMEIGVDNMPVPRKVELGEQFIFLDDHRREVERLRAALKFYADREHYHFESGNWDTVSGEPLNILWCVDEPDFIEDGSVARAALSASAEPEAKS
ncbi:MULTISPECIES: hypothetical protein [unclassified Pseudomonas]|uniref:hypothetical protein n=1 Tax=unclassified Pseudomonas TaxID=196821 RepID=UPI00257FBC27|nr:MULTISPECIES: hypothetical protein [unclassified Pseudomonas]